MCFSFEPEDSTYQVPIPVQSSGSSSEYVRQGGLKEVVELVDGETGLPDDGAQRAAVELFVVGNNQLGKRVVATQDDMAAVLSLLVEPGFLECPHTLSAGETW